MPTKRILCVAGNENIRELRPTMPGYAALATVSVFAARTRAGANAYLGKTRLFRPRRTVKRLLAGAHDNLAST